MSLQTYSDLQGAVANWLHRADLTSYIPDFITLADGRINNDLRHRAMETVQATTIAAGVISVPTNYIELKDAYISSISPYVNLDRKTANWIYDKYPVRVATGTPKFMAREATNFIFGPYPDSNYVVTLDYYNRFPSLSSSVNSVFTSYPGLWLYASLCEAEPFLKNDKRLGLWQAKYREIFELVQKEDADEYLSGAVPQVVAG
jgi:hypothetical protein